MRKRRLDPAFRQKEYARDKVLSKTEARKAQHATQAKLRGRLRKQQAVEYLGNQCSHCLQQWPLAVYEFHHKDPTEKDYNPAQALQLSWDNFKKELDKCILLCANCHRMEHNKY